MEQLYKVILSDQIFLGQEGWKYSLSTDKTALMFLGGAVKLKLCFSWEKGLPVKTVKSWTPASSFLCSRQTPCKAVPSMPSVRSFRKTEDTVSETGVFGWNHEKASCFLRTYSLRPLRVFDVGYLCIQQAKAPKRSQEVIVISILLWMGVPSSLHQIVPGLYIYVVLWLVETSHLFTGFK